MFKVSRFAVAAMLFAGAGVALAQPPGPGGFERKDFEKKKEGPRPGASDRKDGERPNLPPAESLERELQRLRERISEVEGQLRKSREGGEGRRPEPNREEPKSRDARPMGPGGPGGFNPGRNPMGPMGPGGGFAFGRGGPGGPGGPGFVGPGMNLPLEQMSAEQIKQLIGRLQQALEAKTRGGDQPKKPEGNKGDQPKKPDGVKGGGDDVMKRLERIQKELEDIRRSLGK